MSCKHSDERPSKIETVGGSIVTILSRRAECLVLKNAAPEAQLDAMKSMLAAGGQTMPHQCGFIGRETSCPFYERRSTSPG